MHNDDRPSIAERVGRTLSRGNLRQREGPCDLDTVGVLGMVGITERLADAVYRLKYANDHKSYDDALTGVYGVAAGLNSRQRWRLKRSALRWMARRVLDYWLMDSCLTCTGVGYEVILGTPHLSDRACQECHGSRKRAMPWLRKLPRRPEGKGATRAHRTRWSAVVRRMEDSMHRHKHLLVELENAERRIGEMMIAKLAREVRTVVPTQDRIPLASRRARPQRNHP